MRQPVLSPESGERAEFNSNGIAFNWRLAFVPALFYSVNIRRSEAGMAEPVDARDLKSLGAIRPGSSPGARTTINFQVRHA
jgi:hypothetical protein